MTTMDTRFCFFLLMVSITLSFLCTFYSSLTSLCMRLYKNQRMIVVQLDSGFSDAIPLNATSVMVAVDESRARRENPHGKLCYIVDTSYVTEFIVAISIRVLLDLMTYDNA
jgi:hypothetical protein